MGLDFLFARGEERQRDPGGLTTGKEFRRDHGKTAGAEKGKCLGNLAWR